MVVRKSLRISRALFAAYLRTNVRTLENWEQRPRQAERASRPTNQPRQALPGYSPKTRYHLISKIAESQTWPRFCSLTRYSGGHESLTPRGSRARLKSINDQIVNDEWHW